MKSMKEFLSLELGYKKIFFAWLLANSIESRTISRVQWYRVWDWDCSKNSHRLPLSSVRLHDTRTVVATDFGKTGKNQNRFC